MKTYRAESGPFSERVFYSPQEIERICLDELRALGLLPDKPAPIRIERFIERRYGVTPTYEDLGPGVLGLTRFGPRGVEAVVVARSLDDEGGQTAEGRIRTTLAHEAGHGLLHAHLFALAGRGETLFGSVDGPTVLCRDIPQGTNAPQRGYDGRWWEYQANRAIGELLLPRDLVQQAVDPDLETRGRFGSRALPGHRRDLAARRIAEAFEVNPVVARFRLEEFFPEAAERQFEL